MIIKNKLIIKMDLVENKDLKIISTLNLKEIENLFSTYYVYKDRLILNDYPYRDQHYKNELFLWLVENFDKLPEKYQAGNIKFMIDNGADINYLDNNGRSALMKASEKGSRDIVQLLLQNRADVNAKDNLGNTVLTNALNNGKKDIVELLLVRGYNINLKDNFGITELIDFSLYGKNDMVQLLLDYGAGDNR